LNEEKMKCMEIPYGHRIKITKKLKEFKLHRNKANEDAVAFEDMNSTFTEMGVGIGTNSIEDSDHGEYLKERSGFDEEEQQRLFREAVDLFRKGKKIEANLNSKKITTIKELDEEVNDVT